MSEVDIYLNDYEFRADNGSYRPKPEEMLLIEDALRGFVEIYGNEMNGRTEADYQVLQKELYTLRADRERLREAEAIVKELATWSKKYPRERIYAASRQEIMDGELIALEDRAKDFEQALQESENTGDK